ncbi:MAG: PIG-L family deacetylase [Methanobacteriaceae archaeon]|nr:PIG-L family deacetylase [Methanobacteriaceae archaeon]
MNKKHKIISLSVILVLLLVMTYFYMEQVFYPQEFPRGPTLTESDRVLIIAPHPDDEVICNGGLIHYCVENKIPVKAVIITDGDDGKTSPLIRYNESVNGTSILGLSEENVIFLGYRDGSLKNLLNDNWDYNNPFTAADGSTHTSYPYAYQKNATYSGANLQDNLKTIIDDFKPSVVIYPSGDDEQLDHQATSGFVEYTLTIMQYNGSKYTYLLHHLPHNWPSPRTYYPKYFLAPPSQLVGVENGPYWFIFNLNPLNEEIKEESFHAYNTQITSSSYLWSFLRKNELFAQYSTLNLTKKSGADNIDFLTGSPPSTLFYDAKGDVKDVEKYNSLDLQSLRIDIYENSSWISLKTVAAASPEGFYRVHLKIFNPDGVEMVKITVKNGSGELEKETNAKNSSRESIPVIMKNNTMLIKIPSNWFKNSSHFIISAESSLNSEIIDLTPWRVVKIT